MSKFVQIKTQLRVPEMIQRALDDLKLQYSQDTTYQHTFSNARSKVAFLISQNRLKFGLRKTDESDYEIVGDDMQMRQVEKLVAQISQRYAYHMIVEETSRAGFNLVEESVGQDNAIRMTVRRWA